MKSYKQKARNFMKNTKAISPIFATLILIAIAVIAGVVVYMFTSGTLATMTGGSAAQEKMSVQAVQYTSTLSLTVYAQAQGNPVEITNIIVKDSGGNVNQVSAIMDVTTVDTTLTSVVVTIAPFTESGTYTVTVVGAQGGSFVSPSFAVVVV